MDITNLLGGVNLNYIKSSPTRTKTAVIISSGSMKEEEPGKLKLNLLVEIDGKQLPYIINKTSLTNISSKFGIETAAWIGKSILLEIGEVKGRECVIAKPL